METFQTSHSFRSCLCLAHEQSCAWGGGGKPGIQPGGVEVKAHHNAWVPTSPKVTALNHDPCHWKSKHFVLIKWFMFVELRW